MPASAHRWLPFALLAVVACSSDVDPSEASAVSASGTGSGGGGAGGDGIGSTGGSGGQPSGPAGTGGGGLPADCGGADCAPYGGEFCDAPAGTCPGPSNPGSCKPTPDCGEPEGEGVCGCDGQLYIDACRANRNGVDVGPQQCGVPLDLFPCQDTVLCEEGATYCESNNSYNSCKALPPRCAEVAVDQLCDCLEPYFCFSAPGDPECTVDADGNATVSCVITD